MVFAALPQPTEDALHGVMARYAADPSPHKIDLGVGVYRDETGRSPIMRAVAEAELALARTSTSKSYLGLRGDERFLELMEALVLGDEAKDRRDSIQTPGGTGAVYLALALVKKARPEARILIGVPTWPNHLGICQALGLNAVPFPHFDQSTQRVCFDAMIGGLNAASSGDAIILHGPCHNPSGADLSTEQFQAVLDLAVARGVTPIIDAAYVGMAAAPEADCALLRMCAAKAPEALLAVACSKSFGLYRERTGALLLCGKSRADTERARAHAENIARAIYSMPPAHGAALVAHILSDAALRASWLSELAGMRARLMGVRARLHELGASLPALGHVVEQKGIFSLLPLSNDEVAILAREHAIYMPASGRINIAGFKTGDEERFVHALRSVAAWR